MIRIAPMGFDLQPTRILLLILLPTLLMNRLAPEIVRKHSFAPLVTFEKVLIAYVLISIVAVVANYETLDSRMVLRSTESQLAFGVLYFSARDYLSRGDFHALERGIILLAIFSALVAILQYVYDPHFFRVTTTFRGAFGDIGRSTGAFGQEFDHAIYVSFATIVIGLRERGRPIWQWICLVFLFGISAFLAFQRMAWIVFLFATMSVLMVRYWNKPLWRKLGIVAMGIVLVLVVAVPWSEVISFYLPEKFVTDRMMADTLSGRLAYNDLGISLLPKYPFGLGATFESPIYNQEFLDFGLRFGSSGTGYTIHNGFLSAAVRYGIAGGLAFGCMLFGCLIFSARRAVASNSATFILPLIVVVIILYNMTQDFASAIAQSTLLGSWLMGCFAGQDLYSSMTHHQGNTYASTAR